MTFEEITKKIQAFDEERGWGRHHTPKNLAMSIAIEAAEVMEHFQWINTEEAISYAAHHKDEIGEELADVALYLFCLANTLGVSLDEAMIKKMEKNAKRFPVTKK
ncbi:nucleotide pyrophosphohydrolase [Candidatus Uhrbacteria bacterium]|nr:nucleotide pyrophosphohydrolase [Candidatus Uhrbacteria bacterium]